VSIFRIFKPAAHQKEIDDPAVVKAKYKYWRLRIFYSMYIGYAFYYFTRKSLVFAMPGISLDLGFDKAQLGIFGSVFAIAYGCSKFLSGILSDRSNPRYFMAIGLILTGFLNFFFGFSSSIFVMALFWGINGIFQGWGWPPCGRLLTHWYSQSERGTWWGIWNTSHNVGGAVIALIVAYCMGKFGWRVAMYVPGALSIVAGLFLLNRLRDTPQSLGLPPIEKYRNDDPEPSDEKGKESELSAKELLVEYVLKNRYIWVLAISYFFVYIVRQGVNDWGQYFLIESKNMELIAASSCIAWFEIGGFFGSLVAGWASDKVFSGRRGPVNALFSLGAGGAVALLWLIPGAKLIAFSFTLFAIGFFIFGPQMLIGVAAAELSHKKAAGTATGFIGCIAYAGAATAGYPLGAVINSYGWKGFVMAMGICAVVSVLLLLPLWGAKSRQKKRIEVAAAEAPSQEEPVEG